MNAARARLAVVERHVVSTDWGTVEYAERGDGDPVLVVHGIKAIPEMTRDGVCVIESSEDPYVVKLLQAHAEVVSAFIPNGRSEMMKNHPLPPRQP
jgi:hypothetical protein